jgi:beta-N-acetylhexosaminidase
MKYIKYILLTILSLLCILAFLYIKFPKQLKDPDNLLSNPPKETNTQLQELNAQQILDSMSTRQKVGQILMFGFDGTQLSNSTKQLLADDYIGGVIFLGSNISDEAQLKQLIGDIQETNTLPLFIAIDQEGGIVSRLKWNDTLTKAEQDIASPEDAYTTAKARGEILKEIGINMNLAPVVEYITDTDSFMYNRVFRGTKAQVLEKSISTVEGYTDAGVIPVIKHFPGDSNTSSDPHNSFPTVEIKSSQWSTYVQPFSNILSRINVDAMMVGHIQFPNIDSKPASISKEIVGNRLIKQLNYQGLIISDDMLMGALQDIDNDTGLAMDAINAGDDILMYVGDADTQQEVYDYIVNQVDTKSINIDNKVLKILNVKIKYGIIK